MHEGGLKVEDLSAVYSFTFYFKYLAVNIHSPQYLISKTVLNQKCALVRMHKNKPRPVYNPVFVYSECNAVLIITEIERQGYCI